MGSASTADPRHRVTRGGGFDNQVFNVRSAERDGDTPEITDRVLAVRPARTIAP